MAARYRPFRFGVQGRGAASRAEWVDKARRAEALGYATFLVPDHLPRGLAPLVALASVAAATTTLRLGTFVLDNDFRHPVVLAKEAATLDLLSDGRLELGIGAGWMREEYEQSGIPYEPAETRIAKLVEAARLVKALWTEEATTFSGAYYQVASLSIQPRPIQQPHPPIVMGGGGRRMLTAAARAADIVGLGARSLPDGTIDQMDVTGEATARKIGWIREAAGDRLDALELNIFVYGVEATDDPAAAAARLAADVTPAEVTPSAEQVLASPHFLFGPLGAMTETLQARREEYGLSYISVPESLMDALAPIVARLAGT